MRKILLAASGFLPIAAGAQAMPEGFDQTAMMNNYGVSPLWSVFGWLMILCMIVWIVVGILAAVWLWKNIAK